MYITADIGLNHNGDLIRAIKLIRAAAACGFDAVKFQMYTEDLWRDGAPEIAIKGMFNPKWLPAVREECHKQKIDLAITPFYPEAVEIITPYVDWIKIGSYEIIYKDLLKTVTKSDKPVIISVGMGKTVKEIRSAISILPNIKALMYCVSEYPCSTIQIDMDTIRFMKEEFRFPVGWSDHSRNLGVALSSMVAGGTHLELHFDLDDRQGLESADGHVWEEESADHLIHQVRTIQECFLPTDYKPDYSLRTDPSDGKRPIK